MAFLPRARLESASLKEALVHSDLETWEGDGEALNPVNQDPKAEVRQPAERAIAKRPPPNRLRAITKQADTALPGEERPGTGGGRPRAE